MVGLLNERAIPGVAGNYDSTVATDYKHCGCKYEDARQEELSHLSYVLAPFDSAAIGERIELNLRSVP